MLGSCSLAVHMTGIAMRFEVTYLYYGDLRVVSTDTFSFAGDDLQMGERSTAPYLVLQVTDTASGEIINDLSAQISNFPAISHQNWGLRCLHIYPALLCLRRIACTFRKGDKPRHYSAATIFAMRSGASAYSDDELGNFLMNTWKCSRETYPLIRGVIPDHLQSSFEAAIWSTIQRRGPGDVTDEDELDYLRAFGLAE